jgi:metallo-beta-lactamase class B
MIVFRNHAGLLLAAACSAAGLAGAVRAQSYEPPTHSLSPRVQHQVDMAYLVLNGDVSKTHIPSLLFSVDPVAFPDQLAAAGKKPTLPATKVFDQLYYLGINTVSAWALDTSDGIILFDTLNNPEEARTYIEGGLKSVGLDPARIKYIVITHGHGDHFGGAKYLQDKYHARVLMSPADWDFAAKNAARFAPPRFGPPPTHDMDVADGQKLTLGKTTVTLYISPGHTPGAVSSIIPLTDHGRPHVAAFFGGTGLQTIDKDPRKGGFKTMRQSVERFAKISLDANADVVLSNHPFTDASTEKVALVRGRKGAGPNPWVVGKDAVLRFHVAFEHAVDASEAYFEEKAGQN